MEYKFQKGYILVIAPSLLKFFAKAEGVGKKAKDVKGAAFYPFIFVKSEEFNVPWLITHERIHFRQQLETFIIGFFLIAIVERLYARFLLKKSSFESYLWGSGEQEAYLNQHNPDYLETRKIWSQFRYMKNKKRISLLKAGEVVVE